MDPELKKTFREKRKARYEELQAKALEEKRKRLGLHDASNFTHSCVKSNKKLSKLPVIKQTRTSQLRLEKNNPFHNDYETLCKKVDALSAKITTQKTEPKKAIIPIISITHNTPNKNKCKTTSSLRRSVSTNFLNSKQPTKPAGILKSRSIANISISNKSVKFLSPVIDEEMENISLTGRQALLSLTPQSEARYVPLKIQTPLPSDLREQLINWLESQGLRIEDFPVLRSFGLPPPIPYRRRTIFIPEDDLSDQEDENKENVPEASTSSSHRQDDFPKVIDYTNFTTNEDIFGTPSSNNNDQLAIGALEDLHSLILKKCPVHQCDDWLHALKRKFPNITENCKYWECRAAIDAVNGELGQAVQCYEEAIVHGAEVPVIEKHIDQLLEKFSLLKLNTPRREDENTIKKKQTKAIVDARNIFTTNIIKFAVQKRSNHKRNTMMDHNDQLIVTPVRRSSRLSIKDSVNRNGQVINSLSDLSPAERENITFKTNNALDY